MRALAREGARGEYWEREKAALVAAELKKLERMRLHCGREMSLVRAREAAWHAVEHPSEILEIQVRADSVNRLNPSLRHSKGMGWLSLKGQERLRAEAKRRERELMRDTQALTAAMTQYKALHGLPLTFRGMRYEDVMRLQKESQLARDQRERREALQRCARRALQVLWLALSQTSDCV